jgi:hypothetical protein
MVGSLEDLEAVVAMDAKTIIDAGREASKLLAENYQNQKN